MKNVQDVIKLTGLSTLDNNVKIIILVYTPFVKLTQEKEKNGSNIGKNSQYDEK